MKKPGAIVAVVVATFMGIGAAGAWAQQLPVVPTGKYTATRYPRMLNLSADGAVYVGQIQLLIQNHTGLIGTGVLWRNSCRPSCANGTEHGYPVNVYLNRARLLNTHYEYTRLKVTFRSTVPPDFRRSWWSTWQGFMW